MNGLGKVTWIVCVRSCRISQGFNNSFCLCFAGIFNLHGKDSLSPKPETLNCFGFRTSFVVLPF